jgi:hypothetical protein
MVAKKGARERAENKNPRGLGGGGTLATHGKAQLVRYKNRNHERKLLFYFKTCAFGVTKFLLEFRVLSASQKRFF